MTCDTWNPEQITRDAKRAAQPQHFEQGDVIAWAVSGYAGLTDGVSEIHRVYDEAMTYCEEPLPHFISILPPLRSLHPCPVCAERCASGWEKPVKVEDTNASDLARRVA